MREIYGFAAALAIVIGLNGCGGAESFQDESEGLTTDAIINGSAVGTDSVGVVRLHSTFGGATCTGTLLARDWVLTASNCVSGFGWTNKASYGTETRDVATVYRPCGNDCTYPNGVDKQPNNVALVRLSSKFTNVSFDNSTNNLVLMDDESGTLNQYVTCYGYGNNTSSGGAGTLRSGAMPVASLQTDTLQLQTNPFTQQAPAPGDMGGPCVFESGGYRNIVGVNTRGGLEYRRASSIGSWVRNTMIGHHSLGGEFLSSSALAKAGGGKLFIFGRGKDNAVWTNFWNGSGWTDWVSLGGGTNAAPAATSRTGSVELFVRGTDGAIWQNYYSNGAWHSWSSRGGSSKYGPAAASWSDSRVDVFAVHPDGSLRQLTYNNGSWGTWGNLGGGFLSSPAAVAPALNRLVVAGLGLNNRVWLNTWNGSSWTGWRDLGGKTFSSAPAIASYSANHYEVFAVDYATVYHKVFLNGTEGPWRAVGAGHVSVGAVGGLAPNRVDLAGHGFPGSGTPMYHGWIQR